MAPEKTIPRVESWSTSVTPASSGRCSIAAWIHSSLNWMTASRSTAVARSAEGADEQCEPIEVVHRVKERVMAAAAQQATDPLPFLRDGDLFGDLVDDERFTSVFTRAL